MLYFICSSAVLLAHSALVWADDEPSKAAAESSVGARVAAIEAQVVRVSKEYGERARRAAERGTPHARVDQQFHDEIAETQAKFLELVREHPGDPAVFPAYERLMGNDEELQPEVMRLMLQHQLGHPRLGTLCLKQSVIRGRDFGMPTAESLDQVIDDLVNEADAAE